MRRGVTNLIAKSARGALRVVSTSMRTHLDDAGCDGMRHLLQFAAAVVQDDVYWASLIGLAS
jgi:hypothetical protein